MNSWIDFLDIFKYTMFSRSARETKFTCPLNCKWPNLWECLVTLHCIVKLQSPILAFINGNFWVAWKMWLKACAQKMWKRVPLETREIIQNGRCPKVFQMSTRFLRTGVTYHTLHKIGSKSFIEVCMQQKRHIVGDNELKYLHRRIVVGILHVSRSRKARNVRSRGGIFDKRRLWQNTFEYPWINTDKYNCNRRPCEKYRAMMFLSIISL